MRVLTKFHPYCPSSIAWTTSQHRYGRNPNSRPNHMYAHLKRDFFFFFFWRASVYNNVSTRQGQTARAEPHNMEHGSTANVAQRGPTRWAVKHGLCSWPGVSEVVYTHAKSVNQCSARGM